MTTPPLELTDRGCYLVKTVGPWHVDVIPMLYNHRLVLTPVDAPEGYEHGWCYSGTSPAVALLIAVGAALLFDPLTEAEPRHFIKRACPCPHVPPGV